MPSSAAYSPVSGAMPAGVAYASDYGISTRPLLKPAHASLRKAAPRKRDQPRNGNSLRQRMAAVRLR